MKISLIRLFWSACAFLFSVNLSAQISIEKGTIHRDSDQFSRAQKETVWDLEDIALDNGVNSINSVVVYVPTGSEMFFVLERNMLLAGINMSSKSVVGPWPLTRWPHTHVIPEVQDAYNDIGINSAPDEPNVNKNNPGAGCLNETPLRYGTLHELGSDDPLLVLFLNDQMMFFSPQYDRVVLSVYYDGSDWLTKEAGDSTRANYQGDTDAQYISNLYTGVDVGRPGYRAYSKLYIADFDNDTHLDILVWRKVYQSNKKGEQEGFTLLRNEWDHFERNLEAQANSDTGVTGEYLPQNTEEDIIRGWLTENDLTWQKGYPSKSECPGEEGELIPEMHDPLLNDPDVLK